MSHEEVFQFLTDKELRERVPAAFTEGTASISSDRYERIDTLEVMGYLAQKGWKPYKAHQTRSKAEKNIGYERHFIRFRNPNLYVGTREIVEFVPEILLVNSYGARCSLKLYAGVTRTLTGSEFVFDGEVAPKVRMAHSDHYYDNPHDENDPNNGKHLVDLLDQKVYEMADGMDTVVGLVNRMKKVNTNRLDQKEMAQEAISARWDYQWPKTGWETLVKADRYEDESNDLWIVFNRVHEKILKGGWTGAGGKATKPLIEANRELKTNGRLFQVAHTILERLERR